MRNVRICLLLFLFLISYAACKKKAAERGNETEEPTEETANLPADAKDGVSFVKNGTSAIFNLFAPEKQSVYLIGDFNNWQQSGAYKMRKTPDGKRWWIQIDDLEPTKEYAFQYLVDESLRIADPYSHKILDPQNDSYIPMTSYPDNKSYPTGKTTGIVSTFQTKQDEYVWGVDRFNRPDKKNLVIYELLVRDFLALHNYKTLVDTLSYLENLGVNAIELMPINEFEGNLSWGYNPSFYFAPDKYYGTKNMLKKFIDECHKRGIAVILDMVLNHSFGQSPMVQLYFDNGKNAPASNSPWFNPVPTHPYNVGYDFNHERTETRDFVKNVIKYWMEEYKIDGFRFDLSKGFTQKNSGISDSGVESWSAYDPSRIAIWKDYNNFIKSIDPDNFYVILEHFAADQEEKELAKEGMMLWNNLNYAFNEATMGWVDNSDLSRAFYTSHGFEQADNLITYMESHDEERMMFKNVSYGNAAGNYEIQDLTTALKRQEMAIAFLMAVPGPKMIWQFGELGYDISIDQGGRTSDKPILWNYQDHPKRQLLYQAYAKYIKMKTRNQAFQSNDFEFELKGAVKYILLKDQVSNVLVFGNFDVIPQDTLVNFPKTGIWYDYVSGETINIPSSQHSITLSPGEYHIYSSSPLNR